MQWEAITVAVIAIAGVLLALRGAKGDIDKAAPPSNVKMTDLAGAPTLDALYKKHALRQGLEWELVKAIAQTESDENPNAVNPTDPSVGLMQILCVPDGKGGCSNKFNILGWPPPSRAALFNPDYNLALATQILSWNISTYGFRRGIAVYNAWKARTSPEDGPFPNQPYVDKVLGKYWALRQAQRGSV